MFEVLVNLANFLIDLNWLVIDRNAKLYHGLASEQDLIENYRHLQDITQEEVIDFINFKYGEHNLFSVRSTILVLFFVRGKIG
ncbi:hypothetical protein [Paenibacillus sp. R14(2021)]|uniref:hypothetical protein n=1 Tax=Paenibacillus sp. R14(2021) TaxID=2859228 RepID=UPI001C611918|nr:hypothetical protein [Paenibacillus sp. R14(2021)]